MPWNRCPACVEDARLVCDKLFVELDAERREGHGLSLVDCRRSRGPHPPGHLIGEVPQPVLGFAAQLQLSDAGRSCSPERSAPSQPRSSDGDAPSQHYQGARRLCPYGCPQGHLITDLHPSPQGGLRRGNTDEDRGPAWACATPLPDPSPQGERARNMLRRRCSTILLLRAEVPVSAIPLRIHPAAFASVPAPPPPC